MVLMRLSLTRKQTAPFNTKHVVEVQKFNHENKHRTQIQPKEKQLPQYRLIAHIHPLLQTATDGCLSPHSDIT